jgi:hypothetical protein
VDSSVDVVVSMTPARAGAETRETPSTSVRSRSFARTIGARNYPSLPRATSKATLSDRNPPDSELPLGLRRELRRRRPKLSPSRSR